MKWLEYDKQVQESLDEVNANNGILKAQLSVLLLKNVIEYKTSLDQIQQALLAKYQVEYSPSNIEDELIVLQREESIDSLGNDVLEYEEDYFEGY